MSGWRENLRESLSQTGTAVIFHPARRIVIVPFLGEVPLFTEIREGGDKGIPIVISGKENPAGQCLVKIAEALRKQLS